MAVVVVKDVLLFVCLAMNLEFANMVRTAMLLLHTLSAAHGAMLPCNPSHAVLPWCCAHMSLEFQLKSLAISVPATSALAKLVVGSIVRLW